jgi:hypothetical protein
VEWRGCTALGEDAVSATPSTWFSGKSPTMFSGEALDVVLRRRPTVSTWFVGGGRASRE